MSEPDVGLEEERDILAATLNDIAQVLHGRGYVCDDTLAAEAERDALAATIQRVRDAIDIRGWGWNDYVVEVQRRVRDALDS